MKEYIDKIATLDALEKEKRKAESKVLENTHSIIKDSSNCGRLFGVSDSQKIVYDIPTADVVEREKIDKAIEEIEQAICSYGFCFVSRGMNLALDILKKNIGESK